MGFNRPNLPQLIDRVEGDIEGGLNLTAVLRRSFLGVISRALAGLSHLMFGYLAFIEKQAFPDTADGEYLERWAAIWGVVRRAATFAEFNVDLTGADGTVIPAGTIYRRGDGAEYRTDAEVTLNLGGSVKLIAQLANSDELDSNMEVNQIIAPLSPIAGLDSDGLVSSIVIEAENTESDAFFRQRLIDRIQNPPSGGAANDYIQWALSVPGVTRAWVLPENLGPGTVGVAFVEDGDADIIPDAAKVQEVVDFIEERRPVTANVTVTPPVALPIDMTIELRPNTVPVQTAIIAELEDLIRRDAALSGAYASPGVQHDGTILLSRINEAISLGVGELDHKIIEINGAAPADVTASTGLLITLGEITWLPLA